MNLLIILFCSVFSSILYRAGGLSLDEKYWIPVNLRHSWVRDWLCPLFCLLPLFLQHPSWLFIPAYGLMGGTFSTYWDKLFKFDNYWFSGFMLGVSAFPLLFCGFIWWHLLLRSLFITVTWGGFCAIFSNDHAEEHARGFFAGLSSII